MFYIYDSALISILFLITAYSAAGAQCNQPIQRDSKQDTSHVVKTSDLITQTYFQKFLQTCDCLRDDGGVGTGTGMRLFFSASA